MSRETCSDITPHGIGYGWVNEDDHIYVGRESLKEPLQMCSLASGFTAHITRQGHRRRHRPKFTCDSKAARLLPRMFIELIYAYVIITKIS